jgi:gliding motility-associated-like protein
VSLGGDSTVWTVGDSTIVDESILNFFYEDPGVYAISQQVYNEYGCEDTVSFRFEIIDELEIHIPTAFTPNGDDINDVWKPVIAGESRIEGYHLQVISRSHQVMFETFDPSRGWDALDVPRPEKLEDVQNSLFMYVLRVLPEATPLEPEPKWLEYTGHVMIVD